MVTTEQAKEFIINTHPDPDNIYVTYRDIFCNSQIAVKERDLYSLMQQFANHCIEEYKESLKEQAEPLITTKQLFDEILEQPEEKACENCKYWDDISCTNVGSCWCYKLYEPKKNI